MDHLFQNDAHFNLYEDISIDICSAIGRIKTF
jgi:hypothetical protein